MAIAGFCGISAVALGWVGIPALVSRIPAKNDYSYASALEAQSALHAAVDQVKDLTVSDGVRSEKLHEISKICVKFPVLRTQAELVVFKTVLSGGSLYIRGEALRTLASFRSPRAFTLVEQSLKSPEPDLVLSAVQGLESFIGSNRDPAARTLLARTAAAGRGESSAVAGHILVKHRDRRIASAIPSLVRETAVQEEIQTALEAVEKLGLKEFESLVQARLGKAKAQ
ncbi:MAG: hypothetical protein JNL01_03760 [Bdellovibrionales bacterium]|nr:hypothetical protein [Bdellovibrionales bacterium]